jgi:hypothetical protein
MDYYQQQLDPFEVQTQIERGQDPLARTPDELIAAARKAKELGYTPEGLRRLDKDWVTRVGFDPFRTQIFPTGSNKVGGYYIPPYFTTEHIASDERGKDLRPGTIKGPDTIGISQAAKDAWENAATANHEATHRGFYKMLPQVSSYDAHERAVRLRDLEFERPNSERSKFLRETMPPGATTPFYSPEAYAIQLANRGRDANRARQVVQGVGPVPTMQHALKYNTPTREDLASHAKALQVGRDLMPVASVGAPQNVARARPEAAPPRTPLQPPRPAPDPGTAAYDAQNQSAQRQAAVESGALQQVKPLAGELARWSTQKVV